MRENKLYANLKKCIFCAQEIQVMGCYVSKSLVRADPEKVWSICSWPMSKNNTELRQWLGLAKYMHKYKKNYAGFIQPSSSLLKKDATWSYYPKHQVSFNSVKKSLASAQFWSLRTTPSHFTWFVVQVILPSVVPSYNLAMRAASESWAIIRDRWSQRKRTIWFTTRSC